MQILDHTTSKSSKKLFVEYAEEAKKKADANKS